MQQHQAAALEQWKPLIEKMSFKAAQRAKKLKAPYDADDFRQELKMTVLRALESFDPERGVKFSTFIHNAFYHEINKLLRRDDINAKVGMTYSGDNFYAGDESDKEDIWGTVEEDSERSAENLYMDAELMDYVMDHVSPEAAAAVHLLTSNNDLIGQQLAAYNFGVEREAQEGGIRRYSLDMNLAFICKLFGYSHNKMRQLADQINNAVLAYGAVA